MARKPVLEGGKRDELVSAALKLFMENGYEKTSVRGILDAVGGEVGMFYHYFKSKDEIFEAAVELHLKQYVGQINAAVKTNSGITEQYRSLMDLAGRVYMSFNRLGGQNLHWSTASALHQQTLYAMRPACEALISTAIKSGKASNPLHLSLQDLSAFLLGGISGIMHQKPMALMTKDEFNEKGRAVAALISQTLGMDEEALK